MRIWILIAAAVLAQPLVWGVSLHGEEAGAVASKTVASETVASETVASEIGEQINALSGDRYLAREEASQRLFEIGLPAFDALLETANGNLPEAADRAIWILQRAANATEGDAQLPALERLVRVEGQPETVEQARLAMNKLNRPLAIARLIAAGAKILEQGTDDLFNQPLPKRVRIDREWKGGDKGMKDLFFVDDAHMVHITSAPITAEGIAHLKTMPQLRALHIHGVPLSDVELQNLVGMFPHAAINYKRGALLGITGDIGKPTVAMVQVVRPKTAAAKADFRPGDVIVLMNDQPVTTFKSLTDMIAKLAPGAHTTFVIRRGKETLTKKVVLGSW